MYELYHGKFNLQKYAEMQEIFKDKVVFHPRFVTRQCYACDEEALKNCINDGEYCPVLPAGINHENLHWREHVQPANLIKQRVREQCVYESLAKYKKTHWFYYIDYLAKVCISNHYNSSEIQPITEECNQRALDSISKGLVNAVTSFQMDTYNECIELQFYKIFNVTDPVHSVLDTDRAEASRLGVLFTPSISINKHTFRGDYQDPNDLFKTICSVIKHKPEICSAVNLVKTYNQDHALDPQSTLLNRVNASTDAIIEYKRSAEKEKFSVAMTKTARVTHVIGAVVLVIAVNLLCCRLCKVHNEKKHNEKIELQVNESVAQYFAIASSENDTQTTGREQA